MLESAYGSCAAPGAHASAVICCRQRVEIDVALVPCRRGGRFCSRKLWFAIEHQHVLLRSWLASSWPPWRWLASRLHPDCLQITPKAPAPILGHHPQNVFGHDLQHMAPFEALTNGFCMIFQAASLICLAQDHIFGGRRTHLGPGRPGSPFFAQKGRPRNMTLWRDRLPTRFSQGFLRGEWFLCYLGTFWV